MASIECVSCMTDMCSSLSGDGIFPSLAILLLQISKYVFHNLQTNHFTGTHDHATILQSLTAAANDWCNSFNKQLVAFTTDNGSNVVKV